MNKTILILFTLTLVGCCGGKYPKEMIAVGSEYFSTVDFNCKFNVLYDGWNGILQVHPDGSPIECRYVEVYEDEFGELREQ